MQRQGAACGIAEYHQYSGVFLPRQDYDDPLADVFASLSDMIAPPPYVFNGGEGVGSAPPGGDERKTRRLASNRESARRSRLRKQRRLDELAARAARLRVANRRLLVELNRVAAEHCRVARGSARLREEASELRKKLDEMGMEDETQSAASASAGSAEAEHLQLQECAPLA